MALAMSPELQVDSLPLSHQGSTGKQYTDSLPSKNYNSQMTQEC